MSVRDSFIRAVRDSFYCVIHYTHTHTHTHTQEIAEYWKEDARALDAVLSLFVTHSYVKFVTHFSVYIYYTHTRTHTHTRTLAGDSGVLEGG